MNVLEATVAIYSLKISILKMNFLSSLFKP